MILLRISNGITEHFPQRVSEWVMLVPGIGMGMALNYQSNMFSTSYAYTQLAIWLAEAGWAALVLFCTLVRLFALVINGTFRGFPYSPHMRMFAAFISLGFWFQFTLGFLLSAADGTGTWSAVVAYSTFVLLELINLWRASGDLGRRHPCKTL